MFLPAHTEDLGRLRVEFKHDVENRETDFLDFLRRGDLLPRDGIRDVELILSAPSLVGVLKLGADDIEPQVLQGCDL